MPAALSMDIHRRVFEAREAGETTAEVAERFSVSEAFVRKLMRHYRENGSLEISGSGHKRGRTLSLTKEDLERLKALATRQPDLCARELREQLGLSTSDLTVGRARKGWHHSVRRVKAKHKTAMVRKSPADNGIRTRYLPPYSPDLNPIENTFSKLKSMVKSAGQRTIGGLWASVG